jgi:ATP-binding protein involved in chromosome partitioning
VPLFTEIREGGDRGVPVVVSNPEQPAAQAFIKIAEAVRQHLA